MADHSNSPSWAVIVLCFIFFWPVGLFLLIKRLTTDKRAAVSRDKKVPAMGCFHLLVGIALFSIIFGRGGFGRMNLLIMAVALFFVFGGTISFSAAKKRDAEGGKYRLYIDAIVNRGLVFIQDIAAYVGVSEKTAYADLRKMIRMGYFAQAHVDERRGEFHYDHREGYRGGPAGFHGGGAQQSSAQQGGVYQSPGFSPHTSAAASGTGPDAVEVMATCRNCGAHNWLERGSKNECEYCGSPLGG